MLDKTSFRKSVLTFLLPIAIQNLINVAISSTDVIMLGRYSEVALSASSLAGQVQFILILLFFGIASGATVLTAQYWGKKDIKSITDNISNDSKQPINKVDLLKRIDDLIASVSHINKWT